MTVLRSVPRRLLQWLSGRILPPIAYPVLRGPLRGNRFILRSAAGAGGGASVYFNLVEPAKTRELLRILAPGQVVFDIGANIGYYTLLASHKVGGSGRVLAFEPFARNISYLYRHVTLNRADNVIIVPAACSNRVAVVPFVPGPDCATGRLVSVSSLPQSRFSYVATVTVDEVVSRTRLIPDVLKVDVEGAEREVLEGSAQTLASARPVVLVGVHSEALRSWCTSYLRGLGYNDPGVCEDLEGDAELLFFPSSSKWSAAASRT